MVEVVAPDGTTELWVAAVAHRVAVAVVQKAVPEGYIARATNRRLPVSPGLDGFVPVRFARSNRDTRRRLRD